MILEVSLGLLASAVAVESAAQFSLRVRARKFRSAKRLPRGVRAEQGAPIPEALQQDWRARHERAKAAQDRYLLWNARVVTLLAVALLALFTSLVLFDPPPGWLKVLAVLLDLAAFVLVLHWRRAAGAEQSIWIAARIDAELVRHSHHLQMMVGADDVKPMIQRAHAAIDNALFNSVPIDVRALSADLARMQQERRARNHLWLVAEQPPLPSKAWLDYIEAWPKRQRAWFTASYERLHRHQHVRERMLGALYWSGAGIVAFKVLTLPLQPHAAAGAGMTLSSLASFAMVTITTLSATLLAYNANQNARSLFHLYSLQLVRLDDWLRQAGQAVAATDANRMLSSEERQRCANLAVELDGVMFEELLSWLHATAHDCIELAP